VKPRFCALYGLYAVRLNELKAVLKVSAQAGQRGVLKENTVESTAQDDFQEVKRHKMQISNNTSHAAKKLTQPVLISAAAKAASKSSVNSQLLRTSQNF
jgi:hypothetical protein